MKLDDISKELIQSLNFDDILDPDLTDEEKIIYYEDLLKESQEKENKDVEDKIVKILDEILTEGEEFDD